MKKFILATLLICSAGGCVHSSNYSYGNNFPSENVQLITKGKTTESDLMDLFGAPTMKHVKDGTGVVWTYSYHSGTATAQGSVFAIQSQAVGSSKTLSVLIENSVVSNFTFNEGPVAVYQGNSN